MPCENGLWFSLAIFISVCGENRNQTNSGARYPQIHWFSIIFPTLPFPGPRFSFLCHGKKSGIVYPSWGSSIHSGRSEGYQFPILCHMNPTIAAIADGMIPEHLKLLEKVHRGALRIDGMVKLTIHLPRPVLRNQGCRLGKAPGKIGTLKHLVSSHVWGWKFYRTKDMLILLSVEQMTHKPSSRGVGRHLNNCTYARVFHVTSNCEN